MKTSITLALFLLFQFQVLSQFKSPKTNLDNQSLYESTIIIDSTRLDNVFNHSLVSKKDIKLANGYLLKEIVSQDWDGTQWVNSYEWCHTYDNQFNHIETLFQMWEDSVWENNSLSLYQYDSLNNNIEYIRQEWNDSSWVNDKRFTYQYNIDNKIIYSYEEIWSTYASIWVGSRKYYFTYDLDGNLIEERMQEVASTGWTDVLRTVHSYQNNLRIVSLTQIKDRFTEWMDQSKKLYFYDENNNLIELIYQLIELNWFNQLRELYQYDINSNIIEHIEQDWYDSSWYNSRRNAYSYNILNQEIEHLHQDWENQEWTNNYKRLTFYDGNLNLKIQLFQTWQQSIWRNYGKYTYSYISTTSVIKTDSDYTFKLSNNYPNPFNPSTTIKYSIPEFSEVIIKVYDILGNEIETLVSELKPAGNYEVVWNASSIPSGIYFYRLQSESHTETKKMVFIK